MYVVKRIRRPVHRGPGLLPGGGRKSADGKTGVLRPGPATKSRRAGARTFLALSCGRKLHRQVSRERRALGGPRAPGPEPIAWDMQLRWE